MPDHSPISDILGLGKAAEKGIDVAASFLKAILGPASNELGLAIADPIRQWRERRAQNALEITRAAAEIAAASGQPVIQVPGRILWPLLERASLEEDSFLREKWSRLLAAAAGMSNEVLPAFVGILGELSPFEAASLDYVYSERANKDGFHLFEDEAVSARFGVDMSTCEVHRQNLTRLGLLSPLTADDVVRSGENLPQRISTLGYAFLRAVTM